MRDSSRGWLVHLSFVRSLMVARDLGSGCSSQNTTFIRAENFFPISERKFFTLCFAVMSTPPVNINSTKKSLLSAKSHRSLMSVLFRATFVPYFPESVRSGQWSQPANIQIVVSQMDPSGEQTGSTPLQGSLFLLNSWPGANQLGKDLSSRWNPGHWKSFLF